MDIQRVDNISHQEFLDRFYNPGIPVIFKNASSIWKARNLFTPDWFRENYGEKTLQKDGKVLTMRNVMDLAEKSSENNPAPYPLLFNIPNELPELIPLISPLNLNYAIPNWLEKEWFQKGYWGNATELFIGGPGGKFPYLHLDYYHLNAWINQLYGEKRFTVFPRGQEELLYPDPNNSWRSEVNIFKPDYKKHPKFKNATPINFTVSAGETLFIPFGTWHSAYSLTTTISVAFDQLNNKNHRDFLKDVWIFKRREGLMTAIKMYGYAWIGCKIGDKLR